MRATGDFGDSFIREAGPLPQRNDLGSGRVVILLGGGHSDSRASERGGEGWSARERSKSSFLGGQLCAVSAETLMLQSNRFSLANWVAFLGMCKTFGWLLRTSPVMRRMAWAGRMTNSRRRRLTKLQPDGHV